MTAPIPLRSGGFWLALVTAFAACGPDEAAPPPGVPASFEVPGLGPPMLATVRAAPAVGFEGPGGTPFEVALRTPDIASYPCASCHTTPVRPGRAGADEHADVEPVHPSIAQGGCVVCHAADDPSRLVLHSGERVGLDEAYRLCSECHFEEARAWAGGAHGKRLVAWRGRRVVMNCTGCHNPHEPSFGQRIPFPGPKIPRTGRQPHD